MPHTEIALVEQRIRDCTARIATQRAIIASMRAAGRDTAAAVNLLSAMESGQDIRLRRLAIIA